MERGEKRVPRIWGEMKMCFRMSNVGESDSLEVHSVWSRMMLGVCRNRNRTG